MRCITHTRLLSGVTLTCQLLNHAHLGLGRDRPGGRPDARWHRQRLGPAGLAAEIKLSKNSPRKLRDSVGDPYRANQRLCPVRFSALERRRFIAPSVFRPGRAAVHSQACERLEESPKRAVFLFSPGRALEHCRPSRAAIIQLHTRSRGSHPWLCPTALPGLKSRAPSRDRRVEEMVPE